MIIRITAKRAFVLFMTMVVMVVAQAVWWIAFMAMLVDEKVKIAQELGADDSYVAQIQEQEVSRQIMLGSEGILFLLILIFGAWLIYRALAETEALKTRQQNFLLSVTHELKTPLASLRIYIDTLQSAKIPEEKKQAILPRMKQDTNRLEKMVNNILEATRFDHKKYRPDLAEIDMSEMVNNALSDLNQIATEIPKKITHDLQPSIMAMADSGFLRRAIDAILENSLKYHDGQQIAIHAELRLKDQTIELRIKDNGVGFDPNENEILFDRFYRVGSEMTRSTDGTGLGLYLCREIIRAHGGEVSAFSKGTGTGAEFNVRLKGIALDENNPAGGR